MQKENGNEAKNGSRRNDMNLISLRLDVLLAPVSGALMLTVRKLPCLLIAIPERIQDIQPYCSSHMIWLATAGANEQGTSAFWHCSESVRRPGGKWCLRTGLNARLQGVARRWPNVAIKPSSLRR
jgi:hypothetical protein